MLNAKIIPMGLGLGLGSMLDLSFYFLFLFSTNLNSNGLAYIWCLNSFWRLDFMSLIWWLVVVIEEPGLGFVVGFGWWLGFQIFNFTVGGDCGFNLIFEVFFFGLVVNAIVVLGLWFWWLWLWVMVMVVVIVVVVDGSSRCGCDLLGWDGRVRVYWIDRWVWVAGVFFSDGSGWGGYGFSGLRRSVWVCWVERDKEEERERNIY